MEARPQGPDTPGIRDCCRQGSGTTHVGRWSAPGCDWLCCSACLELFLGWDGGGGTGLILGELALLPPLGPPQPATEAWVPPPCLLDVRCLRTTGPSKAAASWEAPGRRAPRVERRPGSPIGCLQGLPAVVAGAVSVGPCLGRLRSRHTARGLHWLSEHLRQMG